MSKFPDLRYVEVIRAALWSGGKNVVPELVDGTHGRAAVMVGSGMSLNSNPLHERATRFPLWSDLVGILIAHLMPTAEFSDEQRRRRLDHSVAVSGALRLAEEFEATFGRQKLDELLLDSIPDSANEPSYLHRLLLSLPWADVLTTNYDTLLERCAPANYDVVVVPEDIPLGTRPRIVKLHGSFPSQRPFVFTEEDFRTYPRRFAPFMNLAQQTIMENVICLLGFSGDDPNFLYWTGWVRDHLGESAPRIYLVGLLDASASQRAVLDRRNVTPVDLSPLFPPTDFPDISTRHRLAIEWFLLCLEAGKPISPENWPDSTPADLTPPSTDKLPGRYPPIHRTSHAEPTSPR